MPANDSTSPGVGKFPADWPPQLLPLRLLFCGLVAIACLYYGLGGHSPQISVNWLGAGADWVFHQPAGWGLAAALFLEVPLYHFHAMQALSYVRDDAWQDRPSDLRPAALTVYVRRVRRYTVGTLAGSVVLLALLIGGAITQAWAATATLESSHSWGVVFVLLMVGLVQRLDANCVLEDPDNA